MYIQITWKTYIYKVPTFIERSSLPRLELPYVSVKDIFCNIVCDADLGRWYINIVSLQRSGFAEWNLVLNSH